MNDPQQGLPADATREAAQKCMDQILAGVEEYQRKMGVTDEEAEAAAADETSHHTNVFGKALGEELEDGTVAHAECAGVRAQESRADRRACRSGAERDPFRLAAAASAGLAAPRFTARDRMVVDYHGNS